MLSAILRTGDTKINKILTGHVISSRYFNGKGGGFSQPIDQIFVEQTLMSGTNFRAWKILLAGFGISLMTPIQGITGQSTAKIVHQSGYQLEVLYCQKNRGRPCHACAKCFIKNLQMEYWEFIETGLTRHPNYWGRYQSENIIKQYQRGYNSNSTLFSFLSQNMPVQNKPQWFQDKAKSYNTNTQWVLDYYPQMLVDFPNGLRRKITDGLFRYQIQPMNEAEIQHFESFSKFDYE